MPPAGLRYDTSPIGTGKNWVTKADPVEGLGPFVHAVVHALMRNGHPEGEAIQIALGVMKRWAAGIGPRGKNGKPTHVTAKTQAKAAAAVAHWEALKAKAHATPNKDERQAITEAGSSAAALLPVGPTMKQAKEAWLKAGGHAFKGGNVFKCAKCGKPIGDLAHMPRGAAQPIPPVPRQAKFVTDLLRRSDGRNAIRELGIRWEYNPKQPRLHGKFAGPSSTPAAIQAKAHLAYLEVWGGKGIHPGMEEAVRKHLAEHPKATAAAVKEHLIAQDFPDTKYEHVLATVKRVKAGPAAPTPAAPPVTSHEPAHVPAPAPHVPAPHPIPKAEAPKPTLPPMAPRVPEPKAPADLDEFGEDAYLKASQARLTLGEARQLRSEQEQMANEPGYYAPAPELKAQRLKVAAGYQRYMDDLKAGKVLTPLKPEEFPHGRRPDMVALVGRGKTRHGEEDNAASAERMTRVLREGTPSVRMPSKAFAQVLDQGEIRNSFETNSSSSTTGRKPTKLARYQGYRKTFEHMYLGVPKEEADAKRPVYGYVGTAGHADWLDPNNPEDVEKAWKDLPVSGGKADEVRANPDNYFLLQVPDPEGLYSDVVSRQHIVDRFNTGDEYARKDMPNKNRYIPIGNGQGGVNMDTLMGYANTQNYAAAYGDVRVDLKRQVLDNATMTAGDSLDARLMGAPARMVERGDQRVPTFLSSNGPGRFLYDELQFHNHPQLSDIDTVRFTGAKPNKAMQDAMAAKGIKWTHEPAPKMPAKTPLEDILQQTTGQQYERVDRIMKGHVVSTLQPVSPPVAA